MVGMRGFEPPTFRSRTERANRTALHPDAGQKSNPGITCQLLCDITLHKFISPSKIPLDPAWYQQ